MAEKKQTVLSVISERATKWYNILIILAVIGTSIGNYMVSNYRHDNHEKEIAKLDERLKRVEGVNYELLAQQLEDIEKANTEIMIKIEKTNERVDKVLEILIAK